MRLPFSFCSSTTLLLALLIDLFLATLSLAAPRAFGRTTSGFKTPSDLLVRAGEDPCAAIFAINNQTVFLAQDSYNCLLTVPFNAAIGAQFVQYLKDTLVFQSTLAYLKDPPPSYQQPPVDLLTELDAIAAKITAGAYKNEYDFEAAVAAVVLAAHDGHVNVNGGALAVFSFGSAYAISSVSIDGIQLPQVYLTEDLYYAQLPGAHFTPSPIKSINGQDVNQFLVNFASTNSFGLLEANSDWNALMYSPAADIQGMPSAFNGQSSLFPGNDLNFVFANGTQLPSQWYSLASVPFGAPSINNGQDFFNFFITNEIAVDNAGSSSASSTTAPASAPTDTPSATTSDSSAPSSSPSGGARPALTSWELPAYPPNPDVVQPDLGYGGFITGYFLNDTKTGVLSIPSFEMTGSAITTFSNTIAEFIRRSQEAGMLKIVIDLQQNYGGNVLLATDAFKQFFPPVNPFGGSRLRSSDFSDALGTTYTQYYSEKTLNQSYADAFLGIPWAVLDYLDANNNQNFTSWPELFGPHADRGDFFSTVQRDNVSSSLFDEVASGGWNEDGTTPAGIVIYGYGNRSTKAQPPYAPENIIILTDGVCHSACAVFVEMMHHEAFVRTVVVGGQPNIGAMQAVGGTRGALAYNTVDLDNDMYFATVINSTVADSLPASHVTETILFWITHANFNLRDQIRQGPDNYFPLQFAYEAADCRIYWTMATFNRFAKLWQYAADAVWENSNLCVAQSTEFPTTRNTVDAVGPSERQKTEWALAGTVPPNTTTVTPSSTTLIPWPDYSVVTSLGSANPMQTSSDSAKEAALARLSPNEGIAQDSIYLKSTTLDKHCDKSKLQPCTPRTHEVCLEVATCENGKFTYDTQCKRQCTSTSQCASANGQQTFCNTYDQSCALTKNGATSCNLLAGLPAQSGSGSRTNTLGGNTGGSQTRNALAGFCEPLVQADAKCLQLANTAFQLLPPSPTLAAMANNGITKIIVDVPTTPDKQMQGKSPQFENVQNDAVQGKKPSSIGEFVNHIFGG